MNSESVGVVTVKVIVRFLNGVRTCRRIKKNMLGRLMSENDGGMYSLPNDPFPFHDL